MRQKEEQRREVFLERPINNKDMKKQFMVEFDVPQMMTEEMARLIPAHRNYINFLLAEGKLKSYALAADRSGLWAIFVAENEFEVLEMIAKMPLADFLTPYIKELMFHNSAEQVLQFSLN